MTFYTEMAAVANDLLSEFGASITLKRTTPGTLDPVTGIESSASTANLTTTGIVKTYATKLIDGTRIQAGDRLLILDDTQVPDMTDQVLIGAEYWNIIDIMPVDPAGTPLVYFVQVRK